MSFPRRLLLVSVGTTALSATSLGDLDDGNNPSQLREEALIFIRAPAGERAKPGLFERVLKAHQDLWNNHISIWPNRLATSAEMVSSYFLLRVEISSTLVGEEKKEKPLRLFEPAHDRIVLLSSDTLLGEFAACINARLMHDHLFSSRCSCGLTFAPGRPVQCRCVQIEILRGLEGTKTGFEEIPVRLDEIFDRHASENTEIIINITGGYKGVIPALAHRCSLYQNASLYYMHEQMTGAARIRLFGKSAVYKGQDEAVFA